MIDITRSMDQMNEDKREQRENLVDFSKLTGSATRLPGNNENILK